MPLKPEYTEIALTLLSLGMLFSYHLQLYRQVRNNPLTTAIGLTDREKIAVSAMAVSENEDGSSSNRASTIPNLTI